MDQPHLLKVLADLDAKNVKFREHSNRFQLSCLLAPWAHEGGDDSTPSAFISTRSEISFVHCFGCLFSGSFMQYVAAYNRYRGGAFNELVSVVQHLERQGSDSTVRIDAALQKWEQKFAQSHEIAQKIEVWDEKELSVFQRIHKRSFLEYRGISFEIAKDFGILWDDKAKRVVVPVRRYDGGLVGVVGRCWCEKCQQSAKTGQHEDCGNAKYYNYWTFPKSRFLFNEYFLDPKKPVYVVEGIFDCLKMVSLGYPNTVALLGTGLSDDQARKLKGLAQPVYLMLDGDAGGIKGTGEAIRMLKGKVIALYTCAVPEGKDPGDMTKEEISSAISGAKLVR